LNGFTLIEAMIVVAIVAVLGLASVGLYQSHLWRQDNYCAAHGPEVTTISYQKVGDVMVPITSTTTPCIEWRDIETDRVTRRS